MAGTTTKEQPTTSDEFRWNLLQCKAMEVRVGKAFALYRESGIEPVLIKGWAAARCYPPEHIRLATDIDFAVSTTDFEKVKKIAATDATIDEAVDLHRELRHLDTVDWGDLVENSLLIPTDHGEFRVLRAEDHLRVLCVHWLTDGGSNKERLWDIYYAIQNRPHDFDWNRLLDTVSPNRRRWIICTLGLTHHFLGLDLSETPAMTEAKDIPKWLITTCEREMAAPVKFLPLHHVLEDRKMLFQQIKKRLRPNPIWATIDMEGSFDAKTRFFYKIGHTFSRIMPSYRRVTGVLTSK